MLGNYSTVADAKKTLTAYGFKISANVYGEIVYLNTHNVKVTMRKYSDGSCNIF
jgi:FAD synthase